jgi:SRSO17 transposase
MQIDDVVYLGVFAEQISLETDILLSSSGFVLIFDESSFAKKGQVSVDVARKWIVE